LETRGFAASFLQSPRLEGWQLAIAQLVRALHEWHRVAEERSRVNSVAMTKTRVAAFPSVALMECMLRSPSVQRWGDTVLRAELMRRADREWALAALSAAERLLQFRRDYAGLEDAIAHHHIASYLGITPVTLSRVRAQVRDHVLNASSRLP
jgi:CRP-like cAMP-binding protein